MSRTGSSGTGGLLGGCLQWRSHAVRPGTDLRPRGRGRERLPLLPARGARPARRPRRRRRRPRRGRRAALRRLAARPAVLQAPRPLQGAARAPRPGRAAPRRRRGGPRRAGAARDAGHRARRRAPRPRRPRPARGRGRAPARAAAATSASRAPSTRRRASPSAACAGDEGWIELHLKLLADVGLVGLPNAGKSSLLARMTRATPKVADYPFTTLEPVLGTIDDGERQLVLADIPGLIEGASEGAGLGHDFLAHVERTRLLVHVVDLAPADGSDPVEQPRHGRARARRRTRRRWPRCRASWSSARPTSCRPGTVQAAVAAWTARLRRRRPRPGDVERDGPGPRRAAARALPPRAGPGARAARGGARGRGGARRAPHLPPGGGPRVPRRAPRRTAPSASPGSPWSASSRATTSTTRTRSSTSSAACTGWASSGRWRPRASSPATTSRSAASCSSSTPG